MNINIILPCPYCKKSNIDIIRVGDDKQLFVAICDSCKKNPVPNWEARLTSYGAIKIYNKKVKEHYALKHLLEGY